MATIDDLLAIMQRLRTPVTGCPWDLEQTYASIAPYTIEEAYEVADAISHNDFDGLKGELGDLLLQVVFHAQMATEEGRFRFEDVVADICEKMVKRHPHVFGTMDIETAEQQTEEWEKQKSEERRAKALARGQHPSLLDDVALGMPSLLRALKLQKRAARVGFDWDDYSLVLDKLEEEIEELEDSIEQQEPKERMAEELGDILFVVANLARHLEVDPEEALRNANYKFERRFRFIESQLAAQGKDIAATPLEEMEGLWVAAKGIEKAA